jgi:hypothetical protein
MNSAFFSSAVFEASGGGVGVAAIAGDRGCAGGASAAAGAGEAPFAGFLEKSTTSPSATAWLAIRHQGFAKWYLPVLITIALLCFLGRSKVELGAGLAAVTLGV